MSPFAEVCLHILPFASVLLMVLIFFPTTVQSDDSRSFNLSAKLVST